MPGRTVHHRMSEHLTFSFSHLFELARELSISLDQDGRHSQNDHRVVMAKGDDTILESAFGPTLCRATHFCRACRNPFESFKPKRG